MKENERRLKRRANALVIGKTYWQRTAKRVKHKEELRNQAWTLSTQVRSHKHGFIVIQREEIRTTVCFYQPS